MLSLSRKGSTEDLLKSHGGGEILEYDNFGSYHCSPTAHKQPADLQPTEAFHQKNMKFNQSYVQSNYNQTRVN